VLSAFGEKHKALCFGARSKAQSTLLASGQKHKARQRMDTKAQSTSSVPAALACGASSLP
jgi:hypothetical protein